MMMTIGTQGTKSRHNAASRPTISVCILLPWHGMIKMALKCQINHGPINLSIVARIVV